MGKCPIHNGALKALSNQVWIYISMFQFGKLVISKCAFSTKLACSF